MHIAHELANDLLEERVETLFVPAHTGHLLAVRTDENGECVDTISHRRGGSFGMPDLSPADRTITIAHPDLFGTMRAGLFKAKATGLSEEITGIAMDMRMNRGVTMEITILPQNLVNTHDPATLKRFKEPKNPLYVLCSMAISEAEYGKLIKLHPELQPALDALIAESTKILGISDLVNPMIMKGRKIVASANCVGEVMRVMTGEQHYIDKRVIADPVPQAATIEILLMYISPERVLALLKESCVMDDSMRATYPKFR